MTGFGSFIWRGISEWNLRQLDIKRFRGKKRVLVALAPDRTDEAMQAFHRVFDREQDALERRDTEIFIEDHPEGPVHKRFECAPQEFKVLLVEKDGSIAYESSQVPSAATLMQRIGPRVV